MSTLKLATVTEIHKITFSSSSDAQMETGLRGSGYRCVLSPFIKLYEKYKNSKTSILYLNRN